MVDTADLLLRDVHRSADVDDETYDNQLTAYVKELRSAFSIRSARLVEDADLLRVLHPAVNTLGYIWLLNNLMVDRTSDIYMISLVAFLTQFDPVQARYAGPEWRKVLDIVGQLVHTTQNTDLLIPYRTAILRIDPQSATFTSNHLQYLELCLQAQRPREALPLLEHNLLLLPHDEVPDIDARALCAEDESYITTSSGTSTLLTPSAVQEFHLLAATVYIGQREWARAILFLELLLCAPGQANPVSALMVEGYKKLILVSLIATSTMPSLADIVEGPVSRALVQLSKPYEALADAFRQRDVARFAAEVQTAGSLWTEDGNVGLMRETAEALRRVRVLDLQKYYTALPLEKVSATLNLSSQDARALIEGMIAGGHLHATLHNDILSFSSWSTNKADNDVAEKLKAQVKRIEALSEAVREADRRYSLTKEYGDWLRRNKRSGDAGAVAYEDPMEMDLEVGRDDEDIMAS